MLSSLLYQRSSDEDRLKFETFNLGMYAALSSKNQKDAAKKYDRLVQDIAGDLCVYKPARTKAEFAVPAMWDAVAFQWERGVRKEFLSGLGRPVNAAMAQHFLQQEPFDKGSVKVDKLGHFPTTYNHLTRKGPFTVSDVTLGRDLMGVGISLAAIAFTWKGFVTKAVKGGMSLNLLRGTVNAPKWWAKYLFAGKVVGTTYVGVSNYWRIHEIIDQFTNTGIDPFVIAVALRYARSSGCLIRNVDVTGWERSRSLYRDIATDHTFDDELAELAAPLNGVCMVASEESLKHPIGIWLLTALCDAGATIVDSNGFSPYAWAYDASFDEDEWASIIEVLKNGE